MTKTKDLQTQFEYAYDATGCFASPGFLSPERISAIQAELDRVGWLESSFEHTGRIEDVVEHSPEIGALAEEIFRAEWLESAMTYPHRLIESYALQRHRGGRLPIHGGAAERLTRAGHPAAEDISCAYLFRSGRMYSLRAKALLYLDAVTIDDDGPLFYVEGSHKANFPFVQAFADGPRKIANYDHLCRRVPVEAGTLVLLNEALLHGALEKTSARPRRLLVFTFAPAFSREWAELARGEEGLLRSGYAVPDTEDSH